MLTIPTEILRIVLMVALAVTGYLMIRAWNDDYGQVAPPTPAAAPTVSEMPTSITETPRAESPTVDVVSEVPSSNDDVPSDIPSDIPAAAVLESDLAGMPAAGSDAARLIRVATPSLELWIDRLGGDIVGLQLPLYTQSIDSDVPIRILDSRSNHTFVAQSGLIGADGFDAGGDRPLYSSSADEYVSDSGGVVVELQHQRAGVVVTKRFEVPADDYLINVEHIVENGSGSDFRTAMFAQLKRDRWQPESSGFVMGPQPYLGAAFTTTDSRYEKIDFDDLDDERFQTDVAGGWAAMLQHYFVAAWVGDPEQTNRYTGRPLSGGNYAVGLVGPQFEVPSGSRGTASASLYVGPKDQQRLEEISPNLNLTVDYGILWWMAVPLFTLLVWIQSVVENWGVAIILLTVAIKIVLYPLSAASYRSMANMRKVTPQLKRIQERYADDRQKLSQEMMALYKKEGANPLGGCLPLVLQMPVFFALYWVLYESVELRHAPFFLWIDDLAAMDPYFILPLLMGGSMYLTTILNPPVPDPMQAKMMKFMPVIFTALFLFFPSGLVLYWLTNNLLSVLQQWFNTRQAEKANA